MHFYKSPLYRSRLSIINESIVGKNRGQRISPTLKDSMLYPTLGLPYVILIESYQMPSEVNITWEEKVYLAYLSCRVTKGSQGRNSNLAGT